MQRIKLLKLVIFFVVFSWNFFQLVNSAYASVTRDLSQTSNFNIRIDGALAGDQLGYSSTSIGTKIYHDINEDGKLELIVASSAIDNNGRNNSGSVYIISGDILDNYSGTGNTLDLADDNNYSLRIDGSVASGALPVSGGVLFADINNDGEEDMIISESFADGTRGNVYILYSNLYKNYINSTGNTLDLADSNNYNILLQGANTGDSFGNISITAKDLDGDSRNDIFLEAHHADYNSRAESGSIYIFFNQLLTANSGTGNLMNVGTTSNFNVRIDGALAGHTFGGGSSHAADYNADGNIDLFIGSDLTDYNSRNDSGSIWIIDNSKFSSYSNSTGNTIDMATTTNWVVRLDGVTAGDRITYANSLDVKDINHDGLQDIVVGSYNADYNSRNNSGSLWLIDNSVFASYTGSGNTVDLTGNFLARIDGAVAADNFTFGSLVVTDVNNNGRNDIVAASRLSNTNGTDSGAVYVFFDSLMDSWSAGATIDLANASSFSVRYDGGTGDNMNFQSGYLGDFNNDSQPDFSFNARNADNNSRNNSGSDYFFYNFPHSFTTPTSVTSPTTNITINGDIYSPNSVTTIALVQYSLNSNDPTGERWIDCSATDGTFDSRSEAFSCTLNTNTTEPHTIYIRAIDSDGFMTDRSFYKSVLYNFEPVTPTCQGFFTPPAPFLFQIDTTSTTAQLYFSPIIGITDYFVSFSESQNAEEHGALITLSDIGVQSYTASYLSPSTTYYFKVRGQNGCQTGLWSNILPATTLSLVGSTITPTTNDSIPPISTPPTGASSSGSTGAATNTATQSASARETATRSSSLTNQQPAQKIDLQQLVSQFSDSVRDQVTTLNDFIEFARTIKIPGGNVAAFATTTVLLTLTFVTQFLRLGRKYSSNIFSNFFHAFGFIQHSHPQGLVYDAHTNAPIPFALLTLTSAQTENHDFLQETVVTDVNGAYEGVQLIPGNFTIQAAHQDFTFPTMQERPHYLSTSQFYKGENFAVTSELDSQLFLIPMDKLVLIDTTKQLKNTTRRVIQSINIINLFWPLFIFSFITTVLYPSLLNEIVLGIQVLMLIGKSKLIFKRPRISGTIKTKRKKPIANAIVKLTISGQNKLAAITKTNAKGAFAFYVKPEKYQIDVIKTGYFWKKDSSSFSIEIIDATKNRKKQDIVLNLANSFHE